MTANVIRQVLPSAERTATNNSRDFRNGQHRGIRLHIDVTDADATPSVVFTIQGKDTLADEYYTVLASAAVTEAGHTTLHVYPGIAAASNVSVSAVLPPYWRVLATHADADAITYSVTAELLI